MSLRALTREHSDYAVLFVNCGGTMVRQRVHIATDSRVRVPEIYTVQWNRDQYSDAIILGSGDYVAMSALVDKAKKDPRLSLAVEREESGTRQSDDAMSFCSDPTSSPVECTPPKKKRRTMPTKKPAAKPSGATRRPVNRRPTTVRPTTPNANRGSQQTQAAVPIPSTSTPVTNRGPNPTPVTLPQASSFTPARPIHTSSQLCPLMSAIAATGSAVTSMQRNIDTLTKKQDAVLCRFTNVELHNQRLERKIDQLLTRQHGPIIPDVVAATNQQVPAISDVYNLTNDELISIKDRTKSPGNFATALTKRFYPELYGMENLRFFKTGMAVESMRKLKELSLICEQICKMKIDKILCATFMMLISVLAGTASGVPPLGRLDLNRVKRDVNDNILDRIVKRN
ncbi:unnamed protein product [Mytilus coruscus]|uniref:BEN domain-containing protein n=1 Tax=Mytilus coruscus TaxID=42192 RepID=A0A6J8C5X6_MYTCO|nr:unnamed protein product [Mytilus coruscus]